MPPSGRSASKVSSNDVPRSWKAVPPRSRTVPVAGVYTPKYTLDLHAPALSRCFTSSSTAVPRTLHTSGPRANMYTLTGTHAYLARVSGCPHAPTLYRACWPGYVEDTIKLQFCSDE